MSQHRYPCDRDRCEECEWIDSVGEARKAAQTEAQSQGYEPYDTDGDGRYVMRWTS